MLAAGKDSVLLRFSLGNACLGAGEAAKAALQTGFDADRFAIVCSCAFGSFPGPAW